MIEAIEGLEFIDTTLRGNTPFMVSIPGGLHHALNTDLPEAGFPEDIFCVYQHLAGSDDIGGGGVRIGATGVYLVKIVGPGSNITGIKTATNLMDALLHGAAGTTSDGTIYYLLRQSSQVLPEVVNGKLVLNTLSQYRSYLQKTGGGL